ESNAPSTPSAWPAVDVGRPSSSSARRGRRLLRHRPRPVHSRIALLRQPDRVELLIEEVRRRDRPAPHLAAVGDDAVLLERVDVVHLLVEQPLLARAQVTPPLLPVARTGSRA